MIPLDWLTLDEAASQLTVSKWRVLQFALDERLVLSVNLALPTNVRLWLGENDTGESLGYEFVVTNGVFNLLMDGEAPAALLHLQAHGTDVTTTKTYWLHDKDGQLCEFQTDRLDLVVRISAIKAFMNANAVVVPIAEPAVLNDTFKAMQHCIKSFEHEHQRTPAFAELWPILLESDLAKWDVVFTQDDRRKIKQRYNRYYPAGIAES